MCYNWIALWLYACEWNNILITTAQLNNQVQHKMLFLVYLFYWLLPMPWPQPESIPVSDNMHPRNHSLCTKYIIILAACTNFNVYGWIYTSYMHYSKLSFFCKVHSSDMLLSAYRTLVKWQYWCKKYYQQNGELYQCSNRADKESNGTVPTWQVKNKE